MGLYDYDFNRVKATPVNPLNTQLHYYYNIIVWGDTLGLHIVATYTYVYHKYW